MGEFIADSLRCVRKVIEEEKNWTRGSVARNAAGKPVKESSPDAVCFCLVGALFKCAPHHDVAAVLSMEAVRRGYGGISNFNDTHTHAEVLAFIDQVIKKEMAA